MNNLKIFKDESGIFEVATKLENGEWIFDTETVAKSLGFTEIKNGKEYIRWRTVNGYLKFSQDVAKGDFIPEPAVYKLAFKASNEVAEKFQDWLAIEVLPSIRKHGMYATDELLNNPDLLIAAATKLKEERAARIEAEKKVAILKPKAEFYDDVAGSKDAIEMSDVAKVLAIKGLGRNNLFEFLREKKILQPNNMPYQQYVDREYFRVLEQKYITPKGETKINIKTLVFQKGVEYIRKLVKEKN